jgi:hypothetical protein
MSSSLWRKGDFCGEKRVDGENDAAFYEKPENPMSLFGAEAGSSMMLSGHPC